MTNAECRRNDRMTNVEKVVTAELRHLGFVIRHLNGARHSTPT